ncbi:MAG: hypothetical protein MUO30_15185 [Anaerolineales bacterium]|nr:hypothetical protein [Anaerolineales bacterium]
MKHSPSHWFDYCIYTPTSHPTWRDLPAMLRRLVFCWCPLVQSPEAHHGRNPPDVREPAI